MTGKRDADCVDRRSSAPGSIADEPICSTDKDEFGYTAYADILAERISKAPTPITVGIFGAWGSGKTSLMNLLKKALESNKKDSCTKFITINVWELSTQEQVWHAFMQRAYTEVQGELWSRKWSFRSLFSMVDMAALKDQFRGNLLRFVVWVVPIIAITVLLESVRAFDFSWKIMGSLGTLFVPIWLYLKPVLKAARQAIRFDLRKVLNVPDYEAQISTLARLKKQFEQMVSHLVTDKKGRLVILVDDLDRCTPDKLPDVLEAIKLFISVERCVFVLGIDHRAVCNAVKKRYNYDGNEAERYLQKFIQIPFHIPPLEARQIEQFLAKEGKDLLLGVTEALSKGLMANPRTVKRALNVFRILQAVAELKRRRWELDPIAPELLAKWVVIQSRYQKLFEYLSTQPDQLLSLESEALARGASGVEPKKEDSWLAECAAAPPIDPGMPIPDGLELDALRQLFLSGSRRFCSRYHRDGVATYISLVARTGTGNVEVGTASFERALLTSNVEDHRQMMINQVIAWAPRFGGKKWEWQKEIDEHYSFYKSVASEKSNFSEGERQAAQWALEQIDAYTVSEGEPKTLRLPGWRHRLGTTREEIEIAKKEGVDSAMAEREHYDGLVNVPAFRIARFPVTIREFSEFVTCIGGQDVSFPLGAVEHDAYFSPMYTEELCWAPGESMKPIEIIDSKANVVAKLKIESFGASSSTGVRFSLSDMMGRTSDKVDVEAPKRHYKRFLEVGDFLVVITFAPRDEAETTGKLLDKDSLELGIAVWRKREPVNLSLSDKWLKSSDWKDWDKPVTEVSWYDAVAYCVYLRKTYKRPYRLPREVEWERAAVDGSAPKTRYHWGNDWTRGRANTEEAGFKRVTKVGEFSPEGDSPYGIADMAGNVWEWCADEVGPYRSTDLSSGILWPDVCFRREDPQRSAAGDRAVRGGSWYDSSVHARVTCRQGYPDNTHSPAVGFRVVLATEWEDDPRVEI